MRLRASSLAVSALAASIFSMLSAPSARAMEATVTVVGETCDGTWVTDGWGNDRCVASLGDSGGGGARVTSDLRNHIPGGNGSGEPRTDEDVKPDEEKSSDEACDEAASGVTSRPVVIASGNKLLIEKDIESGPDWAELNLIRHYDKSMTHSGAFGRSWSSNIEYTLSFDHGDATCNGSLGSVLACTSAQPIAKVLAYRPSGLATTFTLVNSLWTSDSELVLTKVGTDWRITNSSGGTETYDAYGRPKTILDARGVGLTYIYNGSNQLWKVTHTSGRTIQFSWTNGKISAAAAPNNEVYVYSYVGQKLTGVTYPDGLGVRTYHYENSSFPYALTGISINGTRFSRYAYKTDGRVAWSGLEGGVERSTFTYGADFTDVQNALGQTTHYDIAEVNGARRTIAVTRPASPTCDAGIRETFYEPSGNVDYELDALEVKTDYTYADNNRMVQKVTGIGPNGETNQQQITQFVWDSSKDSRLLQIKVYGSALSEPISQTTYAYYPDSDARRRLLKSVAVTNLSTVGISGNTLTTTYDYTLFVNGMVHVMTIDGPLPGTGDRTTYTYDTAGNISGIKNSLNQSTIYLNYNALGEPGRITGANGGIVDFTYNARGSVLTQKKWIGSVAYTTTNAYDSRGQLIKTTNPYGYSVEFGYDDYGRKTSTFTYRDGELDGDPTTYDESITETSSTTYNLNSDPTSHKLVHRYQGKQDDPFIRYPLPILNTTTQFEEFIDYDAGGFISARRGNHGQNIRYTYNANGDLTSVTDSLNRVTTYGYDRQRRINEIVDAKAGHTYLDYGPVGRLVQVRDPRNHTTTYTYDGLGQIWSQTSPDTGTTSFAYNGYGQRIGMTRADGSTLNYTYEILGRLASTGTSAVTRQYFYDSCTGGKGHLCGFSTTGPGATSSSAFTYTSHDQLASRSDNIYGSSYLTSYAYDGLGRVTGIAYPSGVSVGYGYNDGHVSVVTATFNGATHTVAWPSDYQVFGSATTIRYGNGLRRTNQFDTDRRLTRIRTVGASTGATQDLTYAFNANNEITGINNGVSSALSQSYMYDQLSRLTSVTASGANQSFTYDAVGNRTSHTWDGATDTYNIAAASNRLNSISGTRATSYTINAVGNVTAGDGASYTYDAFGRMATATKSGATFSYLVNAQDQRVGKSGPNTVDRFFYSGQNQMLAENNSNIWTSYVWLNGEPVGLVRNNTLYYVHADHLGRPEAVTNAAKAVVWKANNYAFARTVIINAIGELNLGFPGQHFDTETRNWNNGFRTYSARIGRYLQSDPIGIRGGVNPYVYAEANPIRLMDPLGLCACDDPPPAPPGVSVDVNITNSDWMSPTQFYINVRNGGKWDYKQQGREFADFGNFNYGATGRSVGFPQWILLRMAGWAQIEGGNINSEWGTPTGAAPYGDDPADQAMIKKGIEYYDGGCWEEQ